MYLKRFAVSVISFLLLLALVSGYTYGEVSVEGELYRERSLEPGQTYEGTITVSNTGDTKRTIRVYQTDYRTHSSGKVVYGDPGTQPRSNASWIEFDQDKLQIAAGSKSSFRYEITVPDKDLLGSYWSTIMVEPVPRDSEKNQQGGTTLTQTIRYCVKIVTNIEDTGKRSVEITEVDLSRSDGELFLLVGVKNSGERVLFPEAWAEIYGLKSGEKVGRFEGGRKHIFPESSISYNIKLSGISKGNYQTQLVLDNGDENVWGAQFKINL
ncbi:DUF916 domain-containing protein [Candidatus Bipolaricaulota bacterium]|nr:DUF916 domain-containing protein [Candidatus Bipolaricaulota bacterium]